MTLEPRQVEPDANRRWLRDAYSLIKRNFWLWALALGLYLVFSLSLVGFTYALGYHAIRLVVAVLVAVIGLAQITNVALKVDRVEGFSWGTGSVVSTVKYFVHFLKHPVVFVLALLLIAMDLYLIIGDPTFTQATRWRSPWMVVLGHAALAPALFNVLFGEIVGIHRYLAMYLFDLDWRGAVNLTLLGGYRNEKPQRAFTFVSYSVMVVSMFIYLTPFTILLSVLFPVIPLLCAYYYVSFRDIYLHKADNAPAPASSPTRAPATSAGFEGA